MRYHLLTTAMPTEDRAGATLAAGAEGPAEYVV
jgi:hypothetical protein